MLVDQCLNRYNDLLALVVLVGQNHSAVIFIERIDKVVDLRAAMHHLDSRIEPFAFRNLNIISWQCSRVSGGSIGSSASGLLFPFRSE